MITDVLIFYLAAEHSGFDWWIWTTLGLVDYFKSSPSLFECVFEERFFNEGIVSKLYQLHVKLQEPCVVELGAKLSSESGYWLRNQFYLG